MKRCIWKGLALWIAFVFTMQAPLGETSMVFAENKEDTAETGKTELLEADESWKLMGGLMPQEVFEAAAENIREDEIVDISDLLDSQMSNSGSSKRGLLKAKSTSNSWEKYTNYYFYNQMSDAERMVYDALTRECTDFISGTENAVENDKMKYISISQDGDNILGKFGVDLTGSSQEEIETIAGKIMGQIAPVFTIFYYTNPQFYFLRNGYSYSYGYSHDNNNHYELSYLQFAPVIYQNFADGQSRMKSTNNFFSTVEAWGEGIDAVSDSDSLSEKQKKTEEAVRAIHDKIVNEVTYNSASIQNNHVNEETEYTQSAYSTFTLKSAVCAGYAQAFALLCNEKNVDAISVTSNGHEWNKVRVGDSWYNVDCTWDDPVIESGNVSMLQWEFFERDDVQICSDDKSGESHVPIEVWEGRLPDCTLDSEEYGETVKYPSVENPNAYYSARQRSIPDRSTAARLDTPIISVESKEETGKVNVTMSTATDGAIIYYTTDGTDPSVGYTKSNRYHAPFDVLEGTTIKAIAVKDTCWDSDIITRQAVVKSEANIIGHSLSLKGNIGVNYYVALNDAAKNDEASYIEFTLPDQSVERVNTSEVLKMDPVTINGTECYIYTCELSSSQMTGTIHAVKCFDGTCTEIDAYSVKEYADVILTNAENNSEYEKVQPLVKAMLNYGAYAQEYFQYDDSALANADFREEEKKVDLDVSLEDEKAFFDGETEGLSYIGSSLILQSETSIRHYFSISQEHSITDYTFRLGEEVLTPIEKKGYYYVEIPDIASGDLDTKYTLTVGNFHLTYSGLSYVHSVLKSETVTDSLVRLVKALYWYNQAANSYFEN